MLFNVNFCIVETEFLSIAERLKPFAEEKMKIEPFPWFEGYLINMDELYTELILEKVEQKMLLEDRRKLRGYKEMFNCQKSEHENRKVLMKADPGMGKTILGKKMTKDWATDVFQEFSIVFFVALKLVKPGDAIENVIIKQNPELEGLDVSQQKLQALLKKYGNRVLIIFDGLDEHGLGQNKDVLKIIQNRKLLDCRILLSSRPHSTEQIEKYFPTVVRVDGFTEEEARKFVGKFFSDESKIEQIMQFRPSDSREDFPVHKCPILLSILCLLVTRKEIDLTDLNTTMGDLYFKMVICLYKKYTIKEGIPFEQNELLEVMKSIGQLALQTLLSNNSLLQRQDVLRIAGDFALDYGFFAGHKGFTDLTADIYVTFAHRSLAEFFGSFGFLQALSDGKSVDDILGSRSSNPIFMVNPLILRFCLWFQSQKIFDFPEDNFDKLALYAVERIDFPILDTMAVAQMFSSIDIWRALHDKDSLKLKFFKYVLTNCQHCRVLHVTDKFVKVDEQIDGVLVLMSCDLLSKLT